VIKADFFERLRDQIEHAGLLHKEVATRAGIKQRALDMYVGSQRSMPPADVAVRLAAALGVTVEYLVTGLVRDQSGNMSRRMTEDIAKYNRFREIIEDLSLLSADSLDMMKAMIRAASDCQKQEKKAAAS
jgi:transcriptional regulator with XRE-family HTH domain